jgi:hydroxymethylpyrimidine/phosphomethylpyrimidine kinase
MNKKVVLSIAGSDPSSGAGIQADLKSFSLLDLHGTTVITCITSQNTQQVKTIHKLPIDIIENQIDVLFEDVPIIAAKTGMLYDDEIIKCIVKKIVHYKLTPVVDPVMIATSGDPLIQKTYTTSLTKHLLPKTLLLTANIPESEALTGSSIHSIEDMKKKCKVLFSYGPQFVLLKGGHLTTQYATDVLYDGKQFYEFSLPRISNKKAHGSGCSLSALITGLLAQGKAPINAVRTAKYMIWDMIHQGYTPGKGSDVLNHTCNICIPSLYDTNEYYEAWFELKNAIQLLLICLPSNFVPEVGINFAYAVKSAQKIQDICAIDGRISKTKKNVFLCGGIDFGTFHHVASIILAAMAVDDPTRSAINIRYSNDILTYCKKAGFKIGFFNRKNEPSTVSSTMEWGTTSVISNLGFIPDIIYDAGSVGKEPMIRVLGNNPKDVLYKLKKIIKLYEK